MASVFYKWWDQADTWALNKRGNPDMERIIRNLIQPADSQPILMHQSRDPQEELENGRERASSTTLVDAHPQEKWHWSQHQQKQS